MKNNIIAKLLVACSALLLHSCYGSFSDHSLKGENVYILNFENTSISEYHLSFISNDYLEVKTTLTAYPGQCITYKNDTSLNSKSVLLSYSFQDSILSIPSKNIVLKIYKQDGNYVSNSGDILYTSSIVEYINEKEASTRIRNYYDNEYIANVYEDLLKQDNTPLIEIRDGTIFLDPEEEDFIDTSEICQF